MNSSGNSYFGALLRSAGVAPASGTPSRSAPIETAAMPFDPFEAAQEIDADAPVEQRYTGEPPRPETPREPPAREQTLPAAPVPAQAHASVLPLLAGDPHPAVQAALRWVAAADAPRTDPVSAPSAPATVDIAPTPARPDMAPFQAQAANVPPILRAEQMAAAPVRSDPSSVARSKPEPRVEQAPTRGAEAETQPRPRAANPTPTASPSRALDAQPKERTAGTNRTEVHIGTLHVTLDAPSAARFASRSITAPAPETARASPAAGSRPASSRSAGSSLSRSRLPRW